MYLCGGKVATSVVYVTFPQVGSVKWLSISSLHGRVNRKNGPGVLELRLSLELELRASWARTLLLEPSYTVL